MESREQEIIDAIDNYCAGTGLAPTTVGTRIHSDQKLYERLKNGGSCNLKTHKKIMRWFSQNKLMDFKKPSAPLRNKTHEVNA